NNSSIPLAKVELKMGQNSSEIVKPDNLPDQRDCTLSFPVYRTEDKTLGFLTSYLCARDSIFVNGDDAGSADQLYNLLSDPGLDYTFVVPTSDEPLPIIPTPSQNLSVGDKVYTHGGDSGMTQGVILETGVKIIKVQMSKIYSGSCLGAPVYIPLPVPDSDQILDDSKLIIASGDLSYLLPPNNTESSNDSLADDL
ncbi:14050_t:CDS:2, partial [Funneliformis geosporum]